MSRVDQRSLAVAALAMLFTEAPAGAQASGPVAAPPPPAATDAQAAAPLPEGEAGGEIIVTAQRRSERLTEVPIAIVARNAEQLERSGVTNLRDLTVVTPGLRISGNGANAQPSIRGISSAQTDPGNDPNVSLYLDGVYQSNQLANNMDLLDIERVEVLKGPQGTLFGRNATGGAIRVFTRSPAFTPAGTLDVSYGRFDEVAVRGFVTGPIAGETIAASLSGSYLDSDSWSRSLSDGRRHIGVRSYTARGKILLKPGETLRVTLSGAYLDRRDGNATVYQPLDGNTVARLFPGAAFSDRPFRFANNTPPTVDSKVRMASAAIDWDVGDAGTLTSLTAWNKVSSAYFTDADATSLPLLAYPIFSRQRDVSEELTFSSAKLGMFQLTAGLFYYDSIGRYDPLIVEGSFAVPALYGYMRQDTKAIAGFGELNVTPGDHFAFILGARYNHEKRRAAGSYFLAPGRPDALPFLGRDTFDSFTPRASVRYAWDSGDNAYFNYSKGFKSGGFNISGLATASYDPEKIDAYEVGFKSSPRRAISANLSAFIYDYRDQQVSANVDGLNVTANAASSRIWGLDADVVVRPAPQFTTTIGVSYLNAKYDDYPDAVFNVPSRVAGVVCRCGNDTAIGDLSGGRQPFAPAVTVSVTPNYRETFAAGTVDLSASLYATSRFFYDNNARVRQPAYATLAARAAFQPAGTPVTIYVWGRNLTDTRYLNTVFISNAGDGATFAGPRSFGAGARLDF